MAHDKVTCAIKDGFAVCHVCGATKKELRGIPDCVVQPLEGPFCEGVDDEKDGVYWIAHIKPEYMPKPANKHDDTARETDVTPQQTGQTEGNRLRSTTEGIHTAAEQV